MDDNNSNKKTSFKDIRSRFVHPTGEDSDSSSADANSLEVNHFNFDVKDPKSILIAGSPLDSIIMSNSCKDGGDGGDGSAGCCGDSGCDSGGASDGGSCE